MFLVSAKVYNAEVTDPDHRAATSSFYPGLTAVCMIYAMSVGYLFQDIRTLSFLMALPALIVFLCSLFTPSSPFWLVEKDSYEEARATLQRLRGPKYDISPEIDLIIKKRQQKIAGNDE